MQYTMYYIHEYNANVYDSLLLLPRFPLFSEDIKKTKKQTISPVSYHYYILININIIKHKTALYFFIGYFVDTVDICR